jgi:hypothetical protein
LRSEQQDSEFNLTGQGYCAAPINLAVTRSKVPHMAMRHDALVRLALEQYVGSAFVIIRQAFG